MAVYIQVHPDMWNQMKERISELERDNDELGQRYEDAANTILMQNEQISELERENSGLRASRMAYAAEFNGDVGSIHQNIRSLKEERDNIDQELNRALESNRSRDKHIEELTEQIQAERQSFKNYRTNRDLLVAADALERFAVDQDGEANRLGEEGHFCSGERFYAAQDAQDEATRLRQEAEENKNG